MRFAAVCSNQVHHQRATVAGGHEVEDRGDDGHENQGRAHAVVLAHQVEPVARRVSRGKLAHGAHIRVHRVGLVGVSWQGRRYVEALARRTGPEGRSGVEEVVGVVEKLRANILQPNGPAVHADGGRTEDAEPKHGIEEGQGEGVHDHLLDGTSTGDAGHESAHEGGPSDPPAPVEDGPPVHPGGVGSLAIVGPAIAQVELCKGIRVEGNLDEVRKVVTHGLNHHVQDVPGLIQAEDHHHQEVAQHEGRVGNRFDSKVQASHHGGGGEQRDDRDDPGSRVGELVLRREICQLRGFTSAYQGKASGLGLGPKGWGFAPR